MKNISNQSQTLISAWCKVIKRYLLIYTCLLQTSSPYSFRQDAVQPSLTCRLAVYKAIWIICLIE